MLMNVLRGEIDYADLDSVIGSEQGGIRLVVVIQNDLGNFYSHTTIIASMTSMFRKKKHILTHFIVAARKGLVNDSIVLLKQIRTISKSRFIKKLVNYQ